MCRPPTATFCALEGWGVGFMVARLPPLFQGCRVQGGGGEGDAMCRPPTTFCVCSVLDVWFMM